MPICHIAPATSRNFHLRIKPWDEEQNKKREQENSDIDEYNTKVLFTYNQKENDTVTDLGKRLSFLNNDHI
jgi:hypothetical protein